MQTDETKSQGFRFRVSELNFAREEAKRLKCAAGDVIRAGIARLRRKPLTAEEVAAIRLPRGLAAASADDRARVAKIGGTSAPGRGKKRGRPKKSKKTSSP